MAGALDSGRQRVSCGRLAWSWPHTGPGAGSLWPSPSLARVVWLPARLFAACQDLLGGPGVLSPPGFRGPRCQTCVGRQVKGPPAVTPQGGAEAETPGESWRVWSPHTRPTGPEAAADAGRGGGPGRDPGEAPGAAALREPGGPSGPSGLSCAALPGSCCRPTAWPTASRLARTGPVAGPTA